MAMDTTLMVLEIFSPTLSILEVAKEATLILISMRNGLLTKEIHRSVMGRVCLTLLSTSLATRLVSVIHR